MSDMAGTSIYLTIYTAVLPTLGAPHKRYFARSDCRCFYSLSWLPTSSNPRDLAWQKRDPPVAAIRNFFHRPPVERFQLRAPEYCADRAFADALAPAQ